MVNETTLYLDYISNILIMVSGRQLLQTTILFALVLLICVGLKERLPRLQLFLWGLVIARPFIPADWSTPFTLRGYLESYFPALQNLDYWIHLQQLSLLSHFSTPLITETPFITWAMAWVFAWGLTSVLLFSRLLRQRQVYHRITRQGSNIQTRSHQQLFDDLQTRFKLHRPVTFLSGTGTNSPFTIGTLKPIVFVPEEMLESLDQQSLIAVIAHELAHVKRFDDLWGLLRHSLQCLFFFFPLIWFANRQMEEKKEIACDHLAVKNSNLSVADYANCILTIVKHFRSTPASSKVPGLSLKAKSYRARLQALKHYSLKRLRSASLSVVTAIFILVFVMPMGSQQALSTSILEHSQQTTLDDLPLLSPPIKGGQLLAGFSEIHLRAPLGAGKIEVFHEGLDFKAPVGSPVYAMGDGIVTKIVDRPEDGTALTTGGYLEIDHDNGISAIYSYVGNSALSVNQSVEKGQQIGELLRVEFSPRDFPENTVQPRFPARVHIHARFHGRIIDPANVIDLTQYHP